MQLRSYYLVCLLILGVKYSEAVAGPPSYRYGFRRKTEQKNQASPGFYFDPVTGKFRRGHPPADLALKNQQLREELKSEEEDFKKLRY